MKRGGPIRARSTKRAAEERQYRIRAARFLGDNPGCQFPKGCDRVATEVHHRAGRSGWRLLDETRWSALCSPCHKWATEHPAEAFALGISERRHGGAA